VRSSYASACIVFIFVALLSPEVSVAEPVTLESVGLRGGLSGPPIFGKNHPKSFQQYDVTATLRFPWTWEFTNGYELRTNLVLSTGFLSSAGEMNSIVTVVPALTFGPHDDKFALTIGGGAAVLSDHNWSHQSFGGAVQYVATLGIRYQIHGPLGIRYWLQHYSDAAMYGDGDSSRGADMHLFEVTYRY
jgi:Lipid A 3-O-deacylase (PagL)